MAIKLENVGIAVRDIDATISFFTDLGLTVMGRDTISGEWADTAVGLDGNHAKIAVLQTPDGNGQIELFEYIHPEAIETAPTLPNEIGMHRSPSRSTTSMRRSRSRRSTGATRFGESRTTTMSTCSATCAGPAGSS